MDRAEALRRIKTGLQKRSGKTWSVTGGRGTAWGWLKIDAPPARQTAETRQKPGTRGLTRDDYEEVDLGHPGGHMTYADRVHLEALLSLENIYPQGVSIMASNDAYEEYVARAEGRPVTKIAQPYWD